MSGCEMYFLSGVTLGQGYKGFPHTARLVLLDLGRQIEGPSRARVAFESWDGRRSDWSEPGSSVRFSVFSLFSKS